MPLDANKITLCWPNHIEKATISGGGYTTKRPILNAKNPVFSKKSRTLDLDEANTQFTMIFDKYRPVHVVSIAAHNMSPTATARITLYSDFIQSELIYDSGIINIWPEIFATAQLEWEYDNFWFGRLDEESRENFTPLFTHFTPEVQVSQSMIVELFDSSNGDGFIEFGRVLVSDAWQPNINVNYGINFGYENTTTVDRADDNTEYFDVKPQKRNMDFVFSRLNEEEAFARLYSMQRNQGISKEILVAFNLEDTVVNYQRMFIGRASQLNPLSQPFIDNYEASLSLLEIT